jgi:poly(3-hydroxybutyrate) depolymerase
MPATLILLLRSFTIDPARIFAAGMSSGARVVCGFAQGSPLFAGVIAFDAGFPDAQAPTTVPFFFFAAAGINDFNYPEMRHLDDELSPSTVGMAGRRRRLALWGSNGWNCNR